MSLTALLLLAACVFSVEAAMGAECSGNMQESSPPASHTGRDLWLGLWQESDSTAHMLCHDVGTGFKTTTMIRGGQIDIKTGWQSGNPYGGRTFQINRLDGQGIEFEDGQVAVNPDDTDYVTCGKGDGDDPWQFSDVASVVSNVIPDKLEYFLYAFKNEPAKTSFMAGKNHFASDMGNMDSCKQEIVVRMKKPTSGDLSVDVNLRIGQTVDGEDVPNPNAGLVANESDDIFTIYDTNKTGNETSNETINTEVMRFAKTMTCVNEAQQWSTIRPLIVFDGCGQEQNGCRFAVTVPESNMTACSHLYWDPKITPASYPSSSALSDLSASSAMSIRGLGALVTLVCALMQIVAP